MHHFYKFIQYGYETKRSVYLYVSLQQYGITIIIRNHFISILFHIRVCSLIGTNNVMFDFGFNFVDLSNLGAENMPRTVVECIYVDFASQTTSQHTEKSLQSHVSKTDIY